MLRTYIYTNNIYKCVYKWLPEDPHWEVCSCRIRKHGAKIFPAAIVIKFTLLLYGSRTLYMYGKLKAKLCHTFWNSSHSTFSGNTFESHLTHFFWCNINMSSVLLFCYLSTSLLKSLFLRRYSKHSLFYLYAMVFFARLNMILNVLRSTWNLIM